MRGGWGGTGLMMAGAIVMTIGLAIVASEVLALPRGVVPVLVGAVLLVLGAVLRRGFT